MEKAATMEKVVTTALLEKAEGQFTVLRAVLFTTETTANGSRSSNSNGSRNSHSNNNSGSRNNNQPSGKPRAADGPDRAHR